MMDEANGDLSLISMRMMAGILEHAPALVAVCNPTINAFKRLGPDTMAPYRSNWGYDNRTVGLRVIQGHDSAVRVEKRDASADCNPYYLLATDIAAGLDGIEQGLTPTEPCHGNAYALETADPLPLNLTDGVLWPKGPN